MLSKKVFSTFPTIVASILLYLTIVSSSQAGVTAVWTDGSVKLTWTNTASTNCPTNPAPYKILLYKNGQVSYPRAPSHRSIKTVTYDIPRVFSEDTAYYYYVHYYVCSGSGGSYYNAGSVYKNFEGQTIEDRRVIFIHTDALGSPIAETDERGDPTNG